MLIAKSIPKINLHINFIHSFTKPILFFGSRTEEREFRGLPSYTKSTWPSSSRYLSIFRLPKRLVWSGEWFLSFYDHCFEELYVYLWWVLQLLLTLLLLSVAFTFCFVTSLTASLVCSVIGNNSSSQRCIKKKKINKNRHYHFLIIYFFKHSHRQLLIFSSVCSASPSSSLTTLTYPRPYIVNLPLDIP